MCQPTMTKVVVTGTVGFVLLVIGCVLIPVGMWLVEEIVKSDTILEPGSSTYDTWLVTPVPIYIQFWGWHLTNPQEFLEGGVPHLVEKGPYTYQEQREKTDLVHFENSTVTYRPKTTYTFKRELSVGPETDTFTTTNLIALTVANLVQHNATLQRDQYLLNQLSGASLLITIPVSGFVFGYEDPYLNFIKDLGYDIPTKFGIFIGSNATAGDYVVVHTGKDDISKKGDVLVYEGMTEMEIWSNPYANMINGSDGTAFKAFLTPSDKLHVFIDEICRSNTLIYDYPGEIRGIPVGHFTASPLNYANVSYNENNLGFCTPPDNLPCVPGGVINATLCYAGAPIYFSNPHFLYGDSVLFEGVSGMNPIKELHEMGFDMDMQTGVTFQGQGRLQINARVGPYLQFEEARLVKQTYLPVVWLNESSTTDQYNADIFISSSLVPQYILLGIILAFISVGGGLFIGAVITYIVVRRRQDKEEKEMVAGFEVEQKY